LQYTPADSKRDVVGAAPANVKVVLDGGWGRGPTAADSAEGWRGRIRALELDHAGFGVRAGTPTVVRYVPGAAAPAWQWQVGDTELELLLSKRRLFTVAHKGSRGGSG